MLTITGINCIIAWQTRSTKKGSFNDRLTVNFEFFSSENRQFLAVINGQTVVEKCFSGKRPFLAVINGQTEVEKFFF